MKKAKRTAPWHGDNPASNPCDSHEVRQWKTGFVKQQAAAGYIAQGAKEITMGKVSKLLTHLVAQLAVGTPVRQAAVARDGFAFSLLWSTGMRGMNACEIRMQDLWLAPTAEACSAPLADSLFPESTLTAGTRIHVVPQRLKSVTVLNHASVPVIYTGHAIMDPIVWLRRCLQTADAAKHPISDVIVRGTSGPNSFNSTAMTTPGMLYRLRSWLTLMGGNEGESMHSFRRGTAQHLRECGMSVDQIREHLLIKTTHVIIGQYLPPGRHESGTKRRRT